MSNVMTTDRRPSETRFRRPVSVLLLGLPRIFQRNRAVEHGLALLTLFAVGNEITQPFKLPAALRRQIVGGRFDVGGDFFDRSGGEGTGKQQGFAVFAAHNIRAGLGEQASTYYQSTANGI